MPSHDFTCLDCGKKLARNNRCGYCQRCRQFHRAELDGKRCPDCGTPIKKLSDRCRACAAITRGLPTGPRPGGNEHVVLTDAQVVCHNPKCKRIFYLESWQHPKMAWCPKCRNAPTYTDFASYEARANRCGA